ncbi:hypothetical protein F8M41_017143 [Gigaspora margarita]|uniref:Uncharacterized protein n=1 Tax=Gigaspora margarita TaxID=4874 RepID=A0A8H4ANK6_GIGMA|nr:hypothetical protein F8M41_017143 [Gigaspora margarita]
MAGNEGCFIKKSIPESTLSILEFYQDEISCFAPGILQWGIEKMEFWVSALWYYLMPTNTIVPAGSFLKDKSVAKTKLPPAP